MRLVIEKAGQNIVVTAVRNSHRLRFGQYWLEFPPMLIRELMNMKGVGTKRTFPPTNPHYKQLAKRIPAGFDSEEDAIEAAASQIVENVKLLIQEEALRLKIDGGVTTHNVRQLLRTKVASNLGGRVLAAGRS